MRTKQERDTHAEFIFNLLKNAKTIRMVNCFYTYHIGENNPNDGLQIIPAVEIINLKFNDDFSFILERGKPFGSYHIDKEDLGYAQLDEENNIISMEDPYWIYDMNYDMYFQFDF